MFDGGVTLTDRKTGLVATCWSSDRVSKMLCVPSGEKRLGGVS